ncbi:protein DMP2-like [Macadamia integrifolia]|uniref:protein DMP2-like n=1 Tax=Macadamia integrifolia TaxID=60698 RepID=UPI001C52BC84|nr:protein DMP2-like [Macadamia integrifolia]
MATSKNTSSTSGTSKQGMAGKAFQGMASLIKLLPTGTVFLFRFLNPVLTNNGRCNHTINKYLEGILLVVCGFSCCFSTFTDSYEGSDGSVHYGIVTISGLWPSPASDKVNLKSYKLRFGDFVHAFLTVIVFAVVSLLDTNTMDCYYPSLVSAQNVLVMVLTPVIGFLASTVFFFFHNTRHGIGYSSI